MTTQIDSPTRDRESVFRFPAPDDPKPRPARVLGMSLYASMLGTLILAVAVRALLAVVTGAASAWYAPALGVACLGSVTLAVGAFMSVHRRRLPWLLLLASILPLAATVAITG